MKNLARPLIIFLTSFLILSALSLCTGKTGDIVQAQTCAHDDGICPNTCSAQTDSDCRTVTLKTASTAEPEKPLEITINTPNNNTDHIDLYYIKKEDTENPEKVCEWPGGWSAVQRNINPNSTISWTPPNGEYYLVANMIDFYNTRIHPPLFGFPFYRDYF